MQSANPSTSTPPSRKRAVERTQLRTRDGCPLAVAHFHTDASEERGILLIPPLIGGSYILFGRQFSFLVKAGYRIVSLNYRGHAPSEGQFTLRTSFDDTLTLAREIKAKNPDTPLSAVGTCSGSMPIFYILGQDPDLLDRVVFVNAIHHIHQAATPIEAVRMYVATRGLRWPRPYDCHGLHARVDAHRRRRRQAVRNHRVHARRDGSLSFAWAFDDEDDGTRMTQTIHATGPDVDEHPETFRQMEVDAPHAMAQLAATLDRLAREHKHRA